MKNFKMAAIVPILDVRMEQCSSSEFPCLPHASHQVSAKSALPFGSRCRLKILVVILDTGMKRFSISKSPCHPNASHQVWAKSDLPFRSRHGLKIFKMATMVAILDIGMERFLAILNLYVALIPPIKFQLNLTCCLGGDVI